MNATGVLLCLCAACANTVSAYPHAASQMGWRHGSMFSLGSQTPTFIGLGILSAVIGASIYHFVSGALSLWWVLFLAISFLFGGMVFMAVFRKQSGLLALAVAPVAFIAHFFTGSM